MIKQTLKSTAFVEGTQPEHESISVENECAFIKEALMASVQNTTISLIKEDWLERAHSVTR